MRVLLLYLLCVQGAMANICKIYRKGVRPNLLIRMQNTHTLALLGTENVLCTCEKAMTTMEHEQRCPLSILNGDS